MIIANPIYDVVFKYLSQKKQEIEDLKALLKNHQ